MSLPVPAVHRSPAQRRRSRRLATSGTVAPFPPAGQSAHRVLQLVAAQTSSALVVIDRHRAIEWVNPAFERQTGCAFERVRGRLIEEIYTTLTPDRGFVQALHQAVEQGGFIAVTVALGIKAGGQRWINLTGEPMLDASGDVVGFLMVQEDVSERRDHEETMRQVNAAMQDLNAQFESAIDRAQQLAMEAAMANQAKSAFLAMMTHEIRTPLSGVIGMTGILEQSQLDDEQRECLRTIKMSGEALLAVINDTLDYSKIEAGRLDLEQVEFDLRGCAEEAAELVAAKAFAKQLELVCDLAEDVPRLVLGDPVRLRQILVNLLANAVKFTAVGEIVLRIGVESREAGQCTLRIGVHDTGIGIAADKQHRLFKSFSQVDSSTTRQYGGTGLGLAISKSLAELMGGKMWVESEEGSGAAFLFTLRAGLPLNAPVEAPAHPELAGRRVLVIDDNDTSREVLARHLQYFGMEAVCLATTAEADLRLKEKEIFGLALVDLHLKGGDGRTWARQLARDGKCFPVLLLNALGESISDDAIDGVVRKPIRRELLGQRMSLALAGKGTRAGKPAAPVVDLRRVATLEPLRILLAEDNLVNQTVALHQLARLGYEAVVVSNGAQAVKTILAGDFDVILMDVQMPELDGIEATQRIRAAGISRPWIIALTAGISTADRDLARTAGMNDYLAKPFPPDSLKAVLSRGYHELHSSARS